MSEGFIQDGRWYPTEQLVADAIGFRDSIENDAIEEISFGGFFERWSTPGVNGYTNKRGLFHWFSKSRDEWYETPLGPAQIVAIKKQYVIPSKSYRRGWIISDYGREVRKNANLSVPIFVKGRCTWQGERSEERFGAIVIYEKEKSIDFPCKLEAAPVSTSGCFNSHFEMNRDEVIALRDYFNDWLLRKAGEK